MKESTDQNDNLGGRNPSTRQNQNLFSLLALYLTLYTTATTAIPIKNQNIDKELQLIKTTSGRLYSSTEVSLLKFDTEHAGLLSIVLSPNQTISPFPLWKAEILTEDDQILAAIQFGQPSTLEASLPRPGSYFVRIRSDKHNLFPVDYQLNSHFSTEANNHEMEVNNTIQQANLIAGGVTGQLYGSEDVDWYHFHAPQPGTIELEVNLPTHSIHHHPFRITLYTTSRETLIATEPGYDQTIRATLPLAGDYYISVSKGADDYDSGTYQLSYSLHNGGEAVESETNNSANTSTPLSNKTYGQLNSTNDQDWFTLYIPGSGRLTLTLNGTTHTPHYKHWSASFFNSQLEELSTTSFGHETTLESELVQPGNYYVQLKKGPDRYSSNEYWIYNQFFPTQPLNINDDFTIDNTLILSPDAPLTILGDLVLRKGTLNTDGAKLIVMGNIRQLGGTLNIGSGTVHVNGNYTITTSPDAQLIMNHDSGALQIEGNFTTASLRSHQDLLTAGTIQVGGNFRQISENESGKDNFSASQNHRVILNGVQKQVVQFDDFQHSGFNYLDLQNSHADGVHFDSITSMTNVEGNFHPPSRFLTLPDWKLQHDKILIGNLHLSTHLDLDSNQLTLMGTLKQMDGTIKLQGGTLQIKGNLHQTGGEMVIDGGALAISGNYRIGGKDTPPGLQPLLQMHSTTDNVTIGSNFTMQSCRSHQDQLNAGTLTVFGNFTQHNPCNSAEGHYNFHTGGEHTVVFNGSSGQHISLESGDQGARFQHLVLSNHSNTGVRFTTPVESETLESVQSDLNGTRFHLHQWQLDRSHSLTGDLYLSGALHLNGHNLTLAGNLIQNGGAVHLDGGTLTIQGDYQLTLPATASQATSIDEGLWMVSESEHLRIEGTLHLNSVTEQQLHLTAGTLEIQGDLLQLPPLDSDATRPTLTLSSGNHQLLLSGNQQQRIATTQTLQVQQLTITNRSAEGVTLENPLLWSELNTINGHWFGDTLVNDWTLQREQQLPEDLYLNGTLNLAGHTLHVTGNLYQSKGELLLNGGIMIIDGDYQIQGTGSETAPSYSYGQLVMKQPGERIIVGGDFIMDSVHDHTDLLTAGQLEIRGNLIQMSSHTEGLDMLKNLNTSDDHTVVLNGHKQQNVRFEDGNSSHLQHLTLNNKSLEGVLFETQLQINGRFLHNDTHYTTLHTLTVSDSDQDGHLDDVDRYPLDSSRWSDTPSDSSDTESVPPKPAADSPQQPETSTLPAVPTAQPIPATRNIATREIFDPAELDVLKTPKSTQEESQLLMVLLVLSLLTLVVLIFVLLRLYLRARKPTSPEKPER